MAVTAGTGLAWQSGAGEAGITEEDLLRSYPFDKITLTDNTVLYVEPVTPRPLPAYDRKKEQEKRIGRYEKKDREKATGNIGTLTENSKVLMPGEAEDKESEQEVKDSIIIHLLRGITANHEIRDFRIRRYNMREIEYFENLLLLESQRLVKAKQFGRAFECCLRVQARSPNWPGLDDQANAVLFAEGSDALMEGDGERGLRLLRELLARKRDYPGLQDKVSESYAKRIERAIGLLMYQKGRAVLHELEEVAPEHALTKAMGERFVSLAKETVKRSEGMEPGPRLDAVAKALRIWPGLEGGEPLLARAFAAMPTLVVGVTDISPRIGPWVHSPADDRVSGLLYVPILSRDDTAARQGKLTGQLAESLVMSEAGRRITLKIKPGILWSDGSRPVSAVDVAHSLVDRIDPHSPNYEARWADLVEKVDVNDETKVEILLSRVPLRPGAWFLGGVGPAHAGLDGRVATTETERDLVTDGWFRCPVVTNQTIDLVRTEARPAESGGAFRLRRLRETRVTPGQAVGALRRGEVGMIDHVAPDQVKVVLGLPGIKLGRFKQPTVHLIAIDGRNPVLRKRTLRRGLAYAIDRKTWLEEDILKHPPDEDEGPADGPFVKGSYADATGVKPWGYDMLLARAFVRGARKEQAEQPIKLKLEYPAIAEVRVAVGKIVESFEAAGVEITPIELPESRLEAELRSGRPFDLAYRVIHRGDPVADAGPILCPGYDSPSEMDALASAVSPRILQLLLELERASDLPTARALATRIDRESRDELPVIPLWQIVDHYAWRDALKGPAPEAGRLYDGIETWESEPWIARDPWDAQ
jgi:peptide/nickel transport system substrate-binding protein